MRIHLTHRLKIGILIPAYGHNTIKFHQMKSIHDDNSYILIYILKNCIINLLFLENKTFPAAVTIHGDYPRVFICIW